LRLRLEAWAARYRRVLLPAFLVCCLISAWLQSLGKRLWYDEFFSYYIALRPSVADIWRVLLTGFEPHPPLYVFLSHFTMRWSGASPEALRLPAMLAFCVFELAVFLIVVRAYGDLMAWIAVLVAFATAAWPYSFEGRAYTLILASAAVAFLGWQRVRPGYGGFLWAALAGAGVGAAILSHFYGVVVGVPLLAGEILYIVRLRRFRAPVWLALVFGYLSSLVLLPLIRALQGNYAAGYPGVPYWRSFALTYEFLLDDLLGLIILACLIGGFGLLLRGVAVSRRPEPDTTAQKGFEPHEIAAILTLALLPLIQQVMIGMVHGAYFPRHAIATVLGFCLLAPALIFTISKRAPAVAMVLIAACALFALWEQGRAIKRLRAPLPFAALDFLAGRDTPRDLPIAVQDSLVYLRLMRYAPEPLRRRLVFPDSPEMAQKYWGNPVNDRAMAGLQICTPLNVVPFESFIANHRQFLVYKAPDEEQPLAGGWLVNGMTHMGAKVELIASEGPYELYRASLPE